MKLGPSNDTHRVELEIRAAEIAANWGDRPRCWLDAKRDCVACGIYAHKYGRTPAGAQWIGWLAREIYRHGRGE